MPDDRRGPTDALFRSHAVGPISFMPTAMSSLLRRSAALVVTIPAIAGAQSVGGFARDSATRKGLPNLPAVLLVDSGVVATTRADATGVFYLSAPTAGPFRVRFTVSDGTTFDTTPMALGEHDFVQREFMVAVPRERVFFEFQVEKPVVPVRGNVGPHYPEELKAMNVEGEVLVQFVVDTTGRVRMETFKALRSDDHWFLESVRLSRKTAKYQPAEIGGRKVVQLVQQPFQFQLTF